MREYIALLRGINVGGKTRVPMKELVAALESHGYRNITTYLQTGNVLFDAPESIGNRLAEDLRNIIANTFHTSPPVVIRRPDQFAAIVEINPFIDDEDDFKKLHVMFLNDNPAGPDVDGLDPDRSPDDRFVVAGEHIFLHLPGGAARTKLTVDYFEKQLGVVATGRNWNTVLKIHEIATMA